LIVKARKIDGPVVPLPICSVPGASIVESPSRKVLDVTVNVPLPTLRKSLVPASGPENVVDELSPPTWRVPPYALRMPEPATDPTVPSPFTSKRPPDAITTGPLLSIVAGGEPVSCPSMGVDPWCVSGAELE